MPDFIIKTDIDNFLQSNDKAAARDSLGLGTAAEAATGDFATAAEGILAGTALQPADPTLESVTTNGATTLNDISVGKIATLHPFDPINDNIAAGQSSASVGGTGNKANGARSGTFGGRLNQANGSESSTFGGTEQVVRGNESEAFGGTNITLNTKHTNTVGGSNNVVGLATSPAAAVVAKHSLTLGGESSVIENATHSAIVGGETNKIETGHDRSTILGGQNIATDAADTAYAPSLDVQGTVYIKQRAAADVNNKTGKCQLWVNADGDLYLTDSNGTDRQIAFVV